MKITLVILFMIFSSSTLLATSSISGTEFYGYFDYDKQIDTVTCSEPITEGTYTFECDFVLTNGKFKKITIIDNFQCGDLSVEPYMQPGHILIHCGTWGELETYLYKYNEDMNNWFNIAKTSESTPMDGPDSEIKYHDEVVDVQWSLDNSLAKINNYGGSLCKKNEDVHFSCKLDNNKTISICAEQKKVDGKLNYRYGEAPYIEIIHPKEKVNPEFYWIESNKKRDTPSTLFFNIAEYRYTIYNSVPVRIVVDNNGNTLFDRQCVSGKKQTLEFSTSFVRIDQ